MGNVPSPVLQTLVFFGRATSIHGLSARPIPNVSTTALMAALLGREVLTKDYETVRIRIAFHPVDEKLEVSNPAIRSDVTWISDHVGG